MEQSSTIARGTTIRGSLRGEGDLDIQGRVEGNVTVDGELVIGEAALVRSDVSARRVIVRGAVLGNVFADEAVVLEPGARVVGDLGAPTIGIRPGALVRGNVSTGAPGAAQRRASTASAARPARTEARARQAPPSRGSAPKGTTNAG